MATQFLGTYSDLISPEGLMNTLLPRISPFPNIYRSPPFPDHDMLVCSGLAVHSENFRSLSGTALNRESSFFSSLVQIPNLNRDGRVNHASLIFDLILQSRGCFWLDWASLGLGGKEAISICALASLLSSSMLLFLSPRASLVVLLLFPSTLKVAAYWIFPFSRLS